MQIAKLRSELLVGLEQVTAYLYRVSNALAAMSKRVGGQNRRLERRLQQREEDLQNVLARYPSDAIVVTNRDRQFIFANPKAMDLFGVSETNLKNFTIDAFVSYSQMLKFRRDSAPLVRRIESHGKCKIRRLDGGLRIADYTSQVNFIPLRQVYKFYNVISPEDDLAHVCHKDAIADPLAREVTAMIKPMQPGEHKQPKNRVPS